MSNTSISNKNAAYSPISNSEAPKKDPTIEGSTSSKILALPKETQISLTHKDEKVLSQNIKTHKTATSVLSFPQKSTKTELENLSIIHGTNKNTVSILKNKDDAKKFSSDYLKTVLSFKGLQNVGSFSPLNITELFTDFNVSESPRTSDRLKNNTITKITQEFEPKLREKILKSDKKNLTPSDLIKYALEVTKGDYSKAVLTLHNSLKSITYDLRKAKYDSKKGYSTFDSKSKFYNSNPNLGKKAFDEDITIVSKLSNLRVNPNKNTDKMGMWYHFFGVQTVSSREGSIVSYFAVGKEHDSRGDKESNVSKSPIDKEKENLDNLSWFLFSKINSFPSAHNSFLDK